MGVPGFRSRFTGPVRPRGSPEPHANSYPPFARGLNDSAALTGRAGYTGGCGQPRPAAPGCDDPAEPVELAIQLEPDGVLHEYFLLTKKRPRRRSRRDAARTIRNTPIACKRPWLAPGPAHLALFDLNRPSPTSAICCSRPTKLATPDGKLCRVSNRLPWEPPLFTGVPPASASMRRPPACPAFNLAYAAIGLGEVCMNQGLQGYTPFLGSRNHSCSQGTHVEFPRRVIGVQDCRKLCEDVAGGMGGTRAVG